MIKKFYYWLHRKLSRTDERGEYSAGLWQDLIRAKALDLCEGGGNLLEVGCGEGLFLAKAALKKCAMRLCGIDLWPEMLLRAKERFNCADIDNVSLIQASSDALPLKNGFFDLIICVNVFFNLPSEEMVYESLDEIVRVCKSRGRIIFDIRNSKNPLLYLKYKFAGYYDETVKNLPLRTYDLGKIRVYLKASGCEIKNIYHIGWPKNSFAPIFVIEAVKK